MIEQRNGISTSEICELRWPFVTTVTHVSVHTYLEYNTSGRASKYKKQEKQRRANENIIRMCIEQRNPKYIQEKLLFVGKMEKKRLKEKLPLKHRLLQQLYAYAAVVCL